jgi:hypothetical protein
MTVELLKASSLDIDILMLCSKGSAFYKGKITAADFSAALYR